MNFGENISFGAFKKSGLLDAANKLALQNQSCFDYKSDCAVLNRYIYININNKHACIYAIPKSAFTFASASPDNPDSFQAAVKSLSEEELVDKLPDPILRYHICLSPPHRKTYWLQKDELYQLLKLSENNLLFYCCNADASDEQLHIHAMLTVHRMGLKYQLTLNDCLEFAKMFALYLFAQLGNTEQKQKQLRESLKKLLILNGDDNLERFSAKSEKKSRRWYIKGLSVALPYYSSFKPYRVATVFIVIGTFLFFALMYHQ